MLVQVYTYRLGCSFCGSITEFQSDRAPGYVLEHLPEGWTRVSKTFHDCGLTGYSTAEYYERCPECTAEGKEK